MTIINPKGDHQLQALIVKNMVNIYLKEDKKSILVFQTSLVNWYKIKQRRYIYIKKREVNAQNIAKNLKNEDVRQKLKLKAIRKSKAIANKDI